MEGRHHVVFPDDEATGEVGDKLTVVHWNAVYGIEHTAKVRDRENLLMDYSYKNAPPDTKPKYTQPKVNLRRAKDNGRITLHETTEDGQADANEEKKKGQHLRKSAGSRHRVALSDGQGGENA